MFIKLKDEDAKDITVRVLSEIYIYDGNKKVLPALELLMGKSWVKAFKEEHEEDCFITCKEGHVHGIGFFDR